MDKTSFYIELASNSTSFPDNTVAHFKNRICLDQKLRGNWEVGVVEISYTYSWKNIPTHQWVALNEETQRTEKNRNSLQHLNFIGGVQYLKSGHYDDLQSLLREIKAKLVNSQVGESVTIPPRIDFDEITKLLYIKPGKDKKGNKILPEFSEKLSLLLGFDNYTTIDPFYGEDGRIVSNRPPNLNAGYRTLFIYTNHIVPQYIGDIRAPILKTVEVPNNVKYNDQVVIKYTNPHYIPLLFNEFEMIEIDIRDATGDRVPFLDGFTLIKLHLRKQ